MDFLLANPPILVMAVLVLLLVLSIPIGILQQRRRKKAADADPACPAAAEQRSAFMGTGFDLAILLFGILVVGAIALSLIDAFK